MMELENYVVAYRMLKEIADEKKEAKEYLTQMEAILTKNIEDNIKNIQEAMKKTNHGQAIQYALTVREKYLLPGLFMERYSTTLSNFLLDTFTSSYGAETGKHSILDFNTSNDLEGWDIGTSKVSIQNGSLQYVRGNIGFHKKNIRAVAGLCYFSNKEHKIVLQLARDSKAIYSMQVRADGKVSFGVYHGKGGVKNEKFPDMAFRWFCFAICISGEEAHWYLDHKKHYSFQHPSSLISDKVQFQASGGKDTPILIDNLYLGSGGKK
jgi:hypothetical protein